MNKKIIFSTGGTGGHILPAINLMKHFFENGYQVLLVTDKRGKVFIKDYLKFKTYVLNTDTITNKSIIKKFLSICLILLSIIKSIIIIQKEKPDLIFGCGGYASFPISFSSRFLNIPLVIYENNLVIGRANKYLLSLSKKIFLAKEITNDLPSKYKEKVLNVGSILNKKIINYSYDKKKSDKNSFSILVLGGSQAAEIFGIVVPEVIKKIKKEGINIKIFQQCVENQKKLLENFYFKNDIKNYVFEFEKNILDIISSSNLAITRCGASTTAELVHTLTPFIAVPLPDSVDNHQYFNAKYYESKGCCWLLEQSNFNKNSLFNLIMESIKDKNKLGSIRENMKKNYNKNVYNLIENEIKNFI